MRSTPLIKTNWETDAEFQSRKVEFLAQSRRPRGYRITIQLANPSNKSDHLVHYDLERGLITIALPSNTRELFREEGDDKKQDRWLHSSFVETDTVVNVLRTYKASNKLGASVTIKETQTTAYGLAVLNNTFKAQVFRQAMDRDVARRLLVSGTLVLEVALDNRLRQSSYTPFLVEKREYFAPTFEVPLELTTVEYSLPVRLLSVRLISDSDKVLLDSPGTEINPQSLFK